MVKYPNVCYLSGLVPNVLFHYENDSGGEDGYGIVEAHKVEGMAVVEAQTEVQSLISVDCKADVDDDRDIVVCLGVKVLEVHMDSFLGVEVVQVEEHHLVLTLEEGELEANQVRVPNLHESQVDQGKGTEGGCWVAESEVED